MSCAVQGSSPCCALNNSTASAWGNTFWQVVAMVEECDGEGNAVLSLRNKFTVGDELELVGPDTRPFAFAAGDMWDEEGSELTEPRKPEMTFTIRLPKPVPTKSILRRAVDLSAK